jgi:hypothetical protein
MKVVDLSPSRYNARPSEILGKVWRAVDHVTPVEI